MMLLVVAVVSVIPIDQPLPVQGADKFEHLLAYGALMYWWGMVQPQRVRFWLIFLVLYGLALEGVQGLLPHRFMEWHDAVANVVGVVVGMIVLRTRAAGLLAWLETKIGNRPDPRSP